MSAHPHAPADVASVLKKVQRPKRAVVTAGMPYANGPLHIGHLAGAQLPADIHSRWLGMLIGRENVLYVNGTDDHGSTSELAAVKAGRPIREFIDAIHDRQRLALDRFGVGVDVYTGTSRPECFPIQVERAQYFLRRLHANGLLVKRVSRQWYDPKLERFLPDRLVRGQCPNPKCNFEDAYSDECDKCGHPHLPTELINPRSAVSDTVPELRDTAHLWLDMWAVAETMRVWIESKAKTWRASVVREALDRLEPSIRFDGEHEAKYKTLKTTLPKHRSKYAQGKAVLLQFGSLKDMEAGKAALAEQGIASVVADEWAYRSITRDVAWGIPVPADIDPDMAGKTLYVWPDSLIAPISFTEVALAERGVDRARYADFWCDPEATVYQFLGQDNVFFYVLMQGAMWLGTQDDPHRLPVKGELQLTNVFSCFHLLIGADKISKSRGAVFADEQFLDERGYSADQVRYYLAMLGLAEKPTNFDFAMLDDRNRFLAGPMNAVFERPLSATHSKFDGRVPEGVLSEKVVQQTIRMVERYVKQMERADYPALLSELENYGRIVNSLFTQFKPHDDRHPEPARRDALYSSFYVVKNLMIMLYPFVPAAMDRVRDSLRLPKTVFSIDELGTPIPSGHAIGQKQEFFPMVEGSGPKRAQGEGHAPTE